MTGAVFWDEGTVKPGVPRGATEAEGVDMVGGDARGWRRPGSVPSGRWTVQWRRMACVQDGAEREKRVCLIGPEATTPCSGRVQ